MNSKYLVCGALVAIIVLSGCAQPSGEVEAPSTFRLLISDAPADIGDFDSVLVTFSKMRAFRASPPAGEPAWVEKSISGDAVDLTRLVGDLTYPLLEVDLGAGEYTKLELYINTITATADGEIVEVKVPSNKLQITKQFTVSGVDTTNFVFDMNVVKKGATDEYNLQPVIEESGVVGKEIRKEKVKECDTRGKSCRAFEVKERVRAKRWKDVIDAEREDDGDDVGAIKPGFEGSGDAGDTMPGYDPGTGDAYIVCDAEIPCPEGKYCISVQGAELNECVDWEQYNDPCAFHECSVGKTCYVAESYPPQIFCSPTPPGHEPQGDDAENGEEDEGDESPGHDPSAGEGGEFVGGCDAVHPCDDDLCCISLPGAELNSCVSQDYCNNPCAFFNCPIGTICSVAESYPAQVICSQPGNGGNGEDAEHAV